MRRCTTFEGSRQRLDGGGMFGNAPKALWSRWVEADDRNRLPLTCRVLMLEIDDKIALCDAGVGNYMSPKLVDRYGLPPDSVSIVDEISAAGVKEDDVDFVFLSHLHFDHAGGLLPPWPDSEKDDWTPHFKNARYVLSTTQFERAQLPHPRDRASYIPHLTDKLEDSGRLLLVEPKEQIFDTMDAAISLTFSDGHTPGLMHVLVRGEQRTVFFCSDLFTGTPWLHIPIATGYDRFPELLIDEKTDTLRRAVDEDWLVVFPHDLETAASGVRLNEKGRYEAADPVATLQRLEI